MSGPTTGKGRNAPGNGRFRGNTWGQIEMTDVYISTQLFTLHNYRARYPLHRENREYGENIPVRENTGNLEILQKHRSFGSLKLKIP